MKKFSTSRTIAQIAVFSALSIILYMFLKFPLPALFPAWLEIQISDLPALLAGFMMGPLQGATVIVVRTLLKLPFTQTAMVGELADLLCGLAFVLSASFIYKYKRTLKGAVIALIVGCLATTIASIIANYFILLPFYINAYGWKPIMSMFNAVFEQATQETFYTYYILLSVIPFNLLRSLICSLLTFFSYKRLQRFFNFIFTRKSIKEVKKEDNVSSENVQTRIVEEEQLDKEKEEI